MYFLNFVHTFLHFLKQLSISFSFIQDLFLLPHFYSKFTHSLITPLSSYSVLFSALTLSNHHSLILSLQRYRVRQTVEMGSIVQAKHSLRLYVMAVLLFPTRHAYIVNSVAGPS